ncbi:MAG: sulfoxide reductase heme-binding subunit YedZ [Burkholderiaceae bacterium]|jgi:sulfoxide reductase heme-binding subunit YedZ|nr:sulfoxide reductase heme-binding subunit YedZ [Burkholderiaceae bacterium]
MRPATPQSRRSGPSVNVLKVVVFTLCLVPLARVLVLGWMDRLGSNPVEFVTRSSGTWTLVLLLTALAVTPVRRLTGWNWLARIRRMVGLFAFFYACLHLSTYVWLDQWFDWAAIALDVLERPFITAGMATWLVLLTLALTSTDRMVRRLGRRWQRLHRLVYLAGALAILHYAWHKAGKNLLLEPLIYGLILAVLLGLRLWWHLRAARRKYPPALAG